ncbi:MAG: CopG family ribbon-helix-helix protein [Roseiarcus sp.]|jgi:predicted transcriptional regulator
MNDTTSTTFTVRVDTATKKRLEGLAKNTGRSRSFLAAEAISEYLDVNEWQVAGIRAAIESADREGTVPHAEVEAWLSSLDSDAELPIPKPTKSP